MSDYELLLIETTGIQEFVFGSNELAQNIGASELVSQATGLWVFEALDDLHLRHNVESSNRRYSLRRELGTYDIKDQSMAAGLDAEVIYAGGGNALLLFAGKDQATALTKHLTRRALLQAPGLEIVAVHEEGTWNETVLRDQVTHLREELARRKTDRAFSAPLAGLGVTAACVFTGLPAVGLDADKRLISAPVRGKLAAEEEGLARLHAILPQVKARGFEFVYDFDLVGDKDTSSYLAVIHTDGNGMGKRIEEIGKPFGTAAQNADYATALRAFSRTVSRAATVALNATVDALLASYDPAEDRFAGEIKTRYSETGMPQLPFRPIVFGGDDVTFVCDGRLGLALATRYLDVLSKQKLHDQQNMDCRAGVAVAKTHFPFSRSYELAEKLCDSAKDYILKRQAQDPQERITALDWHFAVTGLIQDLDDLRRREYTVPEGTLYLRPYRLTDPAKDRLHAWESFQSVITAFKTEKEWADRRNKIKALRDALRAGGAATDRFRQNYGLKKLPPLAGIDEMQTKGWHDKECGYFDAIEALDLYVPLTGGATK